MKKPKLKTYKKLKAELDRVFSLFIRYRDGGRCFTCDVIKPIKEIQCGHFFSRTYLSTRWDERNCHAQCVGCNIFKKGNMAVYALRMNQKFGPETIEKLFQLSKQTVKISQHELEARIDYYSMAVHQYEKSDIEQFGGMGRI